MTSTSPARPTTTSEAAPELELGVVDRVLGRYGVDEELVRRADDLRPLLSTNAWRCEAERRIPDENLDAMASSGLFDVLAPTRVGGMGGSMATQLAVAASLARGCPSTAWVQTIFCGSRWWVGTLGSPEAQREIFDPATPPLIAGVLGANGPSGTARQVEGGYLVSGRWAFASGSLHANWAILGVAFLHGDGSTADEGIVLADASDLGVQDTWFVAGMAGTGSNTFVADDVFVPAHRAVTGEALMAGNKNPTEPSDRWPTPSVLTLLLMGTIVGTSRQILQGVAEGARQRGISYSTYRRQVDSLVIVRRIGEAALELDTAWLHVLRAAGDLEAAGQGAATGKLDRGRLRASCAYACALLRRSASALMDIAGASAFAEVNPLQRHWRDLNAASRHAFLGTDPMLEMYGRVIFNLDEAFGPI